MFQFFSHPLPAVVILLGVLVFFHEFGHFVVGRLSGIAVEIFSIGFGPRIFGFSHGGTEYRLSWIPLGGYVKFAGSHPSEEVPPNLKGIAFRDASLPKRAITVLAGPGANFILAVVVYTILGMDGVQHPPAVIGEVIEGSPAEAAGVQFGDRITQIGAKKVETWRHIEEAISTSPGKRLVVTVDRAGQPKTLELTPMTVQTTDGAGRSVTIGRAGVALGRLPAIVSVTQGFGAAARAGFRTGDRVTAVKVGEQWLPVGSFPEFVVTLDKALGPMPETSGAAQAPPMEVPIIGAEKAAAYKALMDAMGGKLANGASSQIQLKVQASVPPKDEPDAKDGVKPVPAPAPAPGPERILTLEAGPLASQKRPLSKRSVFNALGIADGQLTVADATDGAKGALQTGDVLRSWNGVEVRDLYALREQLIANNSPLVKLGVLRDQIPRQVEVTLKGVEVQKPEGKATIYQLPLLFWGQPEDPAPIVEKYSNPLQALAYGVRETTVQTGELMKNVTSLITGDIPLKALGGPMLIAKVAGDSAKRGWQTFLGAMALISVNLGLLNLFPIPVLDGGQLVLMGVEGAKRSPLKEAAIENFQKVGFAMIMALVVLATYNDLSRFWKSMLESVVGIFQ